jgi:hypothetical protein
MIGRIRLATTVQIVVMSIAWLAVCLAIDFTFNRHLWARAAPAAPSSVPLSLHLHRLRCNGCPEEIRQALGTLPWLRSAPMTVRAAGAEIATGDYAGWLDIAVAEISQIDFVALDQALRKEGFVASQIEFGGLRHFRLEGHARHLCCPTCQDACEPLPDLGKSRRSERLKWLDSLSTDSAGSTIVFHVRYQGPNDRIDVKELFTAMDEFGLPPSSLRVVATAE